MADVTLGRLHALSRRQRRRVALLALMVSLGGAVVVAHSGLGLDHMGDGATMCLAVISVGAASLLALAPVAAAQLRAARARIGPVSIPASAPPSPPSAQSRAGPAVLQVFLR